MKEHKPLLETLASFSRSGDSVHGCCSLQKHRICALFPASASRALLITCDEGRFSEELFMVILDDKSSTAS